MKRSFAILVVVVVWFALILQLIVSINMGIARGFGWTFGVSLYVAFFTVTTNLLVAVALTLPLVAPRSNAGRLFASPHAITGIAASIVLVSLTYNILLAHIWNPRGLGLIADLLLHDIVPLLFVAYWWLAVPKRSIGWKKAALWAIYPVVYFAYAMVRGVLTDFYPYPFINVTHLGIFSVLLNAIGVLVAFFVILALLLAIKKTPIR
jgi:hypothetical protein